MMKKNFISPLASWQRNLRLTRIPAKPSIKLTGFLMTGLRWEGACSVPLLLASSPAVLVGAAFAWQFYGDDQRKHMVGAGKLHGIVVSTKSSSSNVVPVELASKTSDRVPTQDTALLQAAPVHSVRTSVGRARIVS